MKSSEILSNLDQTFAEPFEYGQYHEDPGLGDRLMDTYLHPYEDIQILIGRLNSPSRVFRKYPEATALVEEALSNDDDESLIVAAELLDETRLKAQPMHETPVSALLTHLRMVDEIGRINADMIGSSASSARANTLALLASRRFAANVSEALVLEYAYSAQFLAMRMTELQALPSSAIGYYNFSAAKLHMVLGDLKERYTNHIYAEAMPGHDEQEPTPQQVDKDTAEVSNTFSEMRARQQYGVKLAYKPYEYGGSLVFSEPVEEAKHFASHPNVHPLMWSAPYVAMVVHSDRRSFKTLKPNLTDIYSGVKGYNFGALGAINRMHIGPDGELYTDRACQVPLRDIFIGKQKYGSYRRLQATILAGYFDLTQPAEIVLSASKAATRHSSEVESIDETLPMDAFRKMVIPRLRYVRAEPTEVAQATTAEDDAIDGPHGKPKRLHSVTWHRRLLPEGWSASPEAMQLAQEMGIVLSKNETLVKAHFRGTKQLGEIIGHELVKRVL